ncbi:conjugative transfer protein [Legionella beliardensis]|uniref:Conjugative transfer protein n=1 Tax=Legionella beliardensis TaxID=91822 RepID=A0A378JPK0_9GAMM|nr:type-F conjugative transfer system pilin assembly thiol-disulfide isomerase TrbB [Legionella beliardensis]STX55685.1 conjugative transfer protein [Legionella beliardensis]
MKGYTGVVFALLFSTGFVYSANAHWLTNLIATREGAAVGLRVKAADKKNGFFSAHGFILFYASTCPHCHQFAPVLKRWCERHHAQVLPLSFDNHALPDFPDFSSATTEWVNAAFQGLAIQYPALFILNFKTQTLYPVGFGAMTESELNARMASLMPKIIAHERGESRP